MVSDKAEIKQCRALSGAGIAKSRAQPCPLCDSLDFSLSFYCQLISMRRIHSTQSDRREHRVFLHCWLLSFGPCCLFSACPCADPESEQCLSSTNFSFWM